MNKKHHRPRKKGSYLVWLVVIIGAACLLGAGYLWGQKQQVANPNTFTPLPSVSKSSLAGIITYSSLTPEEGDQGTIDVLIRPAGTQESFKNIGGTLTLQDRQWHFNEVNEGQNYEVYGIVTYHGVVITRSEVETVTAPALNIVLNFDISWQDLGIDPDSVEEEDKAISGKVTVNGYIPTGSKITLTETVDNQTNNMITIDAASAETAFTIVEVDPHKNYVFAAFLTDAAGRNIGSSSQKINANMSDNQVSFVINSSAIPPTPTPVTVLPPPLPAPTPTPVPQGKVAGRIILNGPLDKNSQLIVLGKKVTDGDYQVWQTIPNPNNEGQAWEYQGTTVGQSYDIKIALQVNNNNVSTSNQITLSAPANYVDFTLNTNFFIPSPSDTQTPSVEPCLRTGSNWETYFKFPKIDNAGQYWIQVGDAEGYSNYYNQKVTASDGDLRLKIGGLPNARKMYVRYTYSVCRGCSSDSNFAPWSKTIGFTCE